MQLKNMYVFDLRQQKEANFGPEGVKSNPFHSINLFLGTDPRETTQPG